jgi:hypothetical protein
MMFQYAIWLIIVRTFIMLLEQVARAQRFIFALMHFKRNRDSCLIMELAK